jgi:tetratricopeptide (TPR) repeat protein
MKASLRKLFQPVLFAIALQLILIAAATAQTRTIRVIVTDNNGHPVADANVQLLGIDVGNDYTKLKTNAKGECAQIMSQPGTYRVVARKKGFEPSFNEKVRADLGEIAEVALTLKPGDDQKPLPWEGKKESSPKTAEPKLPSNVKTFYDKGIQLAKDKKYDEAIAAFTKANDMDSKQPSIFYNRANSYIELKKYDEALADLNRAIELAVESKNSKIKKDIPKYYFQKSIALDSKGQTDEAEKAFKLGVEKAKETSSAEAAQLQLNHGIYLNNKALSDKALSAKAIEAFRQAVSADPGCAEAYYHLGIALSANQDSIDEAIEALTAYLTIGKRSDHLDAAKNAIETLKNLLKENK